MALTGISSSRLLLAMSMSPMKHYKRPFTVCIEGNIGSGKTTFLNHFKNYQNTAVLQEPVELWRNVSGTNLLEMMYTNPRRYSYLFQSYVQLTMLQLHTLKTSQPYKVMERSVYSARCFIENMKRAKMLEEVEFIVLEDWYNWCITNASIETDLIVYLRTTPEVVYQRIKQRARKEENSVSLEYIKQVHQVHEEWLYTQELFTVPAPVMVIDGDKSIEEMVVEFESCISEIFRRKETREGQMKGIAAMSPCTNVKIKSGTSE